MWSVAGAVDRLADRWSNPTPFVAVVAINRRPVRSAWGGGNQWLDQIIRSLRSNAYSVRFSLNGQVDCVLLADPRSGSTVTFDASAVRAYKSLNPRVACIHRVNDNDKHRGSTFRDRLQAEGNQVADHTVFLSEWLRDYEAERWFDPRRPNSVIVSGADTRDFHSVGSAVLRAGETMRLVTHHWSREWNKGFSVYAEIDRLIASGDLPSTELWVIGRWPEEMKWTSARTFPPSRAADVAKLLRQCHVYVTASQWESGGMHFIEGAQCGLPVIYHVNGGGIVEVARRFGIGFTDDVRAAVLDMRVRYQELRSAVLAGAPSGDRMCGEYRTLIQRTIELKRAAQPA